jgi:hypothetical protein
MHDVLFEGEFVPIPTDTVLARLHTLRVGFVREVRHSKVLAVVFHCPVLKSFLWGARTITVEMMVKHPMQESSWPQFDISSIPEYPEDNECASLLERIGDCPGNITHLELGGVFGLRASKALGPHFNSLVNLFVFMGAETGTSPACRDVLCSCPMLEILNVRNISAKDIAEGGPWVCQRLRQLHICFRVKESEQDLQPLIFERLSALVSLERLDMSSNQGDDGGVLEFRLDYGLAQLASLKELRMIRFSYILYDPELTQQLGRDDIEWMTDNWKNLKGIYGCLNRDPEVEAQLLDLLEHRGILHGVDFEWL